MADHVEMPIIPTANQIEAAMLHLNEMPPAQARRVLHKIYETFVDMRPEAKRPKGLTRKMAQLLEVIREYTNENGYSPSQQELADMFGVDRRSITRRLEALKTRGYIVKRRHHRGIVILD